MATGQAFNQVISESFNAAAERFNIQIQFYASEYAKIVDGIHYSYGIDDATKLVLDNTFIAGRLLIVAGILTEEQKGQINPFENTIPEGLVLLGDWKICSIGAGFVDLKGWRFSRDQQFTVILCAPAFNGDNTAPPYSNSIGSLLVVGRPVVGNDPFPNLR